MLLDMFLVWPDFNHYQIISFAGNWPIPAARGQAVGHAPGCRDLKLSILGYDSDRRSKPNTDLNSITKNIHADLGYCVLCMSTDSHHYNSIFADKTKSMTDDTHHLIGVLTIR